MQERQHDFMMANQLDTFRGRPFDDVDARAILGLLIEIDSDQPVERMAEVVGHRHRFDEDFRHDDRAAEIEPHAIRHTGDDAAQPAEIDKARFPESGPGNVRVHVHDVGAEGDVDGARTARPIRGQNQRRNPS
jgi:hypothetical protein